MPARFGSMSNTKTFVNSSITSQEIVGWYGKTVTNLLGTAGDCENSGWDINTSQVAYSTEQFHSTATSIKLSCDASLQEVTVSTTTSITLDTSHKYYLRYYVYSDTEFPDSVTTSAYWPIVEPSFISSQSLTNAVNKWIKISKIADDMSSYTSGTHNLRIDLDNGNYGSGSIWIDSIILIDLTNDFGAGNEPPLAWCDEYIPFTTSTATIGS